jgi:hypothetical protein
MNDWLRNNYAKEHEHEYPEGFFWWLRENFHIWKAFEEKAYMMAAVAKRPRYSARTIIEVMRWDSDIREKKPLFKISNNMVPGLARLWMAKHGKNHPKFFQLQEVRTKK